MNNEEPNLSIPANEQVSTTGHKLPEQPKIPTIVVPRPVGMFHLMNQWQPMGIRVTIDLPFIGDDRSFFFLIRNGPFIPNWRREYLPDHTDYHLPNVTGVVQGNLKNFAWNNMRNVWPGTVSPGLDFNKSHVHITQYDFPPVLAQLSQCFRRWRGDMQYRFRVISGFATQGYTFVAPIKNVVSPIAIYDEYTHSPQVLTGNDFSYRGSMLNSYVMSDTSMFRHIEVTVPYEYPAPYYDQYAWMARRVSPAFVICTEDGSKPKRGYRIVNEPHGDNWLGYTLRGAISTTQTGGQIIIELEYRACEGFQFADPGLPPDDFTYPIFEHFYEAKTDSKSDAQDEVIKQVPDENLTSDGLTKTMRRSKPDLNVMPSLETSTRRNSNPRPEPSGYQIYGPSGGKLPARGNRRTRDVDEDSLGSNGELTDEEVTNARMRILGLRERDFA